MDHRACPVRLDAARRRRGGRPRRGRRRTGRALPRHPRPPRGPQGSGPARRHAVHLPAARALHRSRAAPCRAHAASWSEPAATRHRRPIRAPPTSARVAALRDRGPLRRAPGRPGRSRRGARRGGLRHPHPGGRQRASSTARPPTAPVWAGTARARTCCCPGRGAGSCSARSSPTPTSRPPRSRWPTGAGRARAASTAARPGPSSPPGWSTPAAAWPGWCRPPGCSRSSTGPRSATASTAATRARRSARPTAARAGPGRRPSDGDGEAASVPVLDLLRGLRRGAAGPPRPVVHPRRDPDHLRRNALVVLGNVGDGGDAEVVAALVALPAPPEPAAAGARGVGGPAARARRPARAARRRRPRCPRCGPSSTDEAPARHERLPAQARRHPDLPLGAVAAPPARRDHGPHDPASRARRTGTGRSRSGSCAAASGCCCPPPRCGPRSTPWPTRSAPSW